MRVLLTTLSIIAILAVALVAQALLDSAVAGWIGFVAILVLAVWWFLGGLPGSGSLGGGA